MKIQCHSNHWREKRKRYSWRSVLLNWVDVCSDGLGPIIHAVYRQRYRMYKSCPKSKSNWRGKVPSVWCDFTGNFQTQKHTRTHEDDETGNHFFHRLTNPNTVESGPKFPPVMSSVDIRCHMPDTTIEADFYDFLFRLTVFLTAVVLYWCKYERHFLEFLPPPRSISVLSFRSNRTKKKKLGENVYFNILHSHNTFVSVLETIWQ